MGEEEKEKSSEPEEAEINMYMESADGEAPSEEQWKEYWKVRYKQVKADYQTLQMQKGENDTVKRKEIEVQLVQAFKNNYKERKNVVIELRRLGEKIEDRFVPKSAT